jgi:cell cycle arrest protein BUB3
MGFGVFPSYYFVSFFPVVQSSLSPSTIIIQTVRLYDIAANEEKTKFDHRAAVLSTAFSDASHAYSGGLDASLRE